MGRFLLFLAFILILVMVMLPAMVMWERVLPVEIPQFFQELFPVELEEDAEEDIPEGSHQDYEFKYPHDFRIYRQSQTAAFLDGNSLGGPVLQVYHHEKEEIMKMHLEDYLVGVIAAEMPSSFSLQAIKAQAVAARTYTLVKHRNLGGEGCKKAETEADVCTDATHCQAWINPAEFDELNKLEYYYRAVSETHGESIFYDGKLIKALYHSTCGGQTECSAAKWDNMEYAYLAGVNCDYCKHSPHYRTQTAVCWDELSRLSGQDLPAISQVKPLSQSYPILVPSPSPSFSPSPAPSSSSSTPESILAIEKYTPGDRVAKFRLGEAIYTGPELRRLLDLPSASFTLQKDIGANEVIFENRGFGHGVGLCQYGADGLARHEDFHYSEIITFYYPGSELRN